MAVVLHDSDDVNYDVSQVLITPITSAKAAVRDGKLLVTHVELLPSEYAFIKNKSFVSTHQIMPINREWLDKNSKGEIISSKLLEIDLGILLASDLSTSVNEIVTERISELREEALKKIEESNIEKMHNEL